MFSKDNLDAMDAEGIKYIVASPAGNYPES